MPFCGFMHLSNTGKGLKVAMLKCSRIPSHTSPLHTYHQVVPLLQMQATCWVETSLIDLGHPRQAEVRWLHPPSPCYTVQEELHRPVQSVARVLYPLRIPIKHLCKRCCQASRRYAAAYQVRIADQLPS